MSLIKYCLFKKLVAPVPERLSTNLFTTILLSRQQNSLASANLVILLKMLTKAHRYEITNY